MTGYLQSFPYTRWHFARKYFFCTGEYKITGESTIILTFFWREKTAKEKTRTDKSNHKTRTSKAKRKNKRTQLKSTPRALAVSSDIGECTPDMHREFQRLWNKPYKRKEVVRDGSMVVTTWTM